MVSNSNSQRIFPCSTTIDESMNNGSSRCSVQISLPESKTQSLPEQRRIKEKTVRQSHKLKQQGKNVKYGKKCCMNMVPRRVVSKCKDRYEWQHGKYEEDLFNSQVIPKCHADIFHKKLCQIPLSIYQSSICELGRKLLFGEMAMPRNKISPLPCYICESILLPYHGYYRKYEILPVCKDQYMCTKDGKKQYRSKMK